jgi:hypothetical protein
LKHKNSDGGVSQQKKKWKQIRPSFVPTRMIGTEGA